METDRGCMGAPGGFMEACGGCIEVCGGCIGGCGGYIVACRGCIEGCGGYMVACRGCIEVCGGFIVACGGCIEGCGGCIEAYGRGGAPMARLIAPKIYQCAAGGCFCTSLQYVLQSATLNATSPALNSVAAVLLGSNGGGGARLAGFGTSRCWRRLAELAANSEGRLAERARVECKRADTGGAGSPGHSLEAGAGNSERGTGGGKVGAGGCKRGAGGGSACAALSGGMHSGTCSR